VKPEILQAHIDRNARLCVNNVRRRFIVKAIKHRIAFGAILVLGMVSVGLAQAGPAQNRIPQQVIINGQHVNAVYVQAAGGGLQSFTCSNPQQYATQDGATQGWACYEAATGTWLLNAVPPATTQTPTPAPAPAPAPVQPQPPVVYQQQPPAIVYQQPAAVVYQQPAVVYAAPAYPVVIGGVYPPGVILGAAAINATARIASAALIGPRFIAPRAYYPVRVYRPIRGYRW
jgi:hypothetical protein